MINIISLNKRAQFNYQFIECYEVGIVLSGTEVKSLRTASANIVDAYAFEKNGEMWLQNMHISQYKFASQDNNHEPSRIKKLLMQKKQIKRCMGKLKENGTSLVISSIYFNERGIVKCKLCLARGKTKFDKRETIKKRDWERRKSSII